MLNIKDEEKNIFKIVLRGHGHMHSIYIYFCDEPIDIQIQYIIAMQNRNEKKRIE